MTWEQYLLDYGRQMAQSQIIELKKYQRDDPDDFADFGCERDLATWLLTVKSDERCMDLAVSFIAGAEIFDTNPGEENEYGPFGAFSFNYLDPGMTLCLALPDDVKLATPEQALGHKRYTVDFFASGCVDGLEFDLPLDVAWAARLWDNRRMREVPLSRFWSPDLGIAITMAWNQRNGCHLHHSATKR